MVQNKGYRPDIDGLRAIAVLSVLLYHLGFAPFAGGYVGVDVFFVISGYLITRLIKAEVEREGDFRFGNFYARRARRLFPALGVTLLLTTLVCIALLSPEHLERFGGAVVHSVVSLSNVFFWSESGYFDAEAHVKPLLHTWSLGVEEQFYLFWPVLVVTLIARLGQARALLGLLAVGLVSFGLNFVFIDGAPQSWIERFPGLRDQLADGESMLFFLAPFRVFEFVLGAMLVWFGDREVPPAMQELLVLAGLALVGYAVFAFDETTIFPSYNALVPCIGAALLILGGRARLTGLLLRNRMSVGIGLISYSVYLVHWPLIVLYSYWRFSPITFTEQCLLGVASVVLGVLMYRMVEQPLRHSRSAASGMSGAGFGVACALGGLMLIVPAANMWANSGWTWRIDEQQEMVAKARQRQKMNLLRCSDDRDSFCTGKPSGTPVTLIGDSHAGSLFYGFGELPEKTWGNLGTVRLHTQVGTLPFFGVWNNGKKQNFDAVFDGLDDGTPVVIHARFSLHWLTERAANESSGPKFVLAKADDPGVTVEQSQANFMQGLEDTLRKLGDRPVVIVGAVPHLGGDVTSCLLRPTFLFGDAVRENCRAYDQSEARARTHDVNELLRGATQRSKNIRFVDPVPIFCSADERYCDIVRRGKLLYRDDDHLSNAGAMLVAARVARVLNRLTAVPASAD